ncbi:hypothetical protein AGR5A_pa20013 [Agrobacterium genomosp. 5 str. CFBP 6626]|nr:hypothetical protein AGR5A_pa20013 [Agrobacterium genomosp. 5 str. CFBP 6626]
MRDTARRPEPDGAGSMDVRVQEDDFDGIQIRFQHMGLFQLSGLGALLFHRGDDPPDRRYRL